MTRGIRLRLAVTYVAVALLGILIVAFVVQFAGGRRFDSFLAASAQDRAARLLQTIEHSYGSADGWRSADIDTVDELARSTGLAVAVFDPQGGLVFTAGRVGNGGVMRGGGMMNGMGPGSVDGMIGTLGERHGVQRWVMSIVSNGQTIGTALVVQPAQVTQSQNSSFRHDVTLYLIVAGVGAALVALLVSVAVSRRIARPLVTLTAAAEEVAQGRRDVAVPAEGTDEVAHLGRAFNDMTVALAKQEEWRRTMTADLAHELRTPLATIQARVEALEDGVLPPTPENLRIIGEEVERLGRLLGTMRMLDDLDAAGFALDLAPVDLGALGEAVVAGAEHSFQQAGIDLSATTEPAIVEGDADRLRQVMLNLLDNARKFAPCGGRVELRVLVARTGSGGSSGGSAVLTVTDDGPGIPSDDLPHVFERFYRGHAARDAEGAGLGLAIVRRLVDAHGGTVSADSSEAGTVFTVELPIASAVPPAG